MSSPRPSFVFRFAASCLPRAAAVVCVAGAGLGVPSSFAQESEGGTVIRLVETVDVATGERSREPFLLLSVAELQAVQEALRIREWEVASTGRLDEATASALFGFQEARGLSPCGCVSLETVRALGLPTEVALIRYRGAGRGRSEGMGTPAASEAPASSPEARASAASEAGSGGGREVTHGVEVWTPFPVPVPAVPQGEPPPERGTADDRGESRPTPPGVRPAPPDRAAPARHPGAGPRAGRGSAPPRGHDIPRRP